MSDQPPNPDVINIEVNGVPVQARKGQMIMQVTDVNDVYIPRFCYHDKLTIAANCRMCLVEVEKAPKPMPACATPIAEGMKIFTRSPKAIAAQKATMEFLLINHPLDCPICDQGGECELQDLAMGFGRDVSRYSERKRVVKDKNLGPLVSTDMTRCIHCTRCVRFTQEIEGFQEMGTIGRGEATEIGTFIEQSIDHELSANIIDLCPVGALNNKPYRYRARAWEMTQHPLVSPHDSVGTNLFAHVLRGRMMRAVPRPNEAINETWIADRDRFSCEGIYSEDRLQKPWIREAAGWREIDWESALDVVADRLGKLVRQHGGEQLGVLASPLSTLEELHLLTRLTHGLGSTNLDHRLRRSDFRTQDRDPVFPWLGTDIAALQSMNSLLFIGANLRKEAPILAHRLRQAALKGGAVSFVNPARYDFRFPIAGYLAGNGHGMVEHLAAILSVAAQSVGRSIPAHLKAYVIKDGVQAHSTAGETQQAIARQLTQGERRLIVLGAIAQRDPAFGVLRELATTLGDVTGAQVGYIADGGNTVAAHLAGVLPHRGVGGQTAGKPGLNVNDMLAAKLKAYVLLGAIEPEHDIAAPQALEALQSAELVIALSPYGTAKQFAHIVLPIGTYAETSGTYVNLEGRWQSVPGAARPLGESRPAWKVLRVLGNLLELPGFDYVSSEQVRDELKGQLGAITPSSVLVGSPEAIADADPYSSTESRIADIHVPEGDVPLYAVDAIVRRSPALQATPEALKHSAPAIDRTASGLLIGRASGGSV